MLAGMGPDMFSRAWDALRTAWVERGWTRFLEYFEATWVQQLPGWWVNYLGSGTPRTQAALEGLWPSVHALLGAGRKSPKTVAQLLAQRVLPYMARRQRGTGNERPVLTLLERQDAVVLATEGLERLYTQKVDGVEWMYCFKRVLGLDRPTVTQEYVKEHEELLKKKQWDFKELCLLSSMRKFNVDLCCCERQCQLKFCYHQLGAKIKNGQVHPAPNELPDTSNEGRRRDRNIRQQLNSAHCFMCDRNCQNAFNLDAHMLGASHRKQAGRLLTALLAATSKDGVKWGRDITIKKVKVRDVAHGQPVFMIEASTERVLQGIVAGVERRRGNVTLHVAISTTKEKVFSGGQTVYGLEMNTNKEGGKGKAKRTKRASATSPPGRQGKRKQTGRRQGTKGRGGGGKRKAKRTKRAPATSPDVEPPPISALERKRAENIARLAAKRKELGIETVVPKTPRPARPPQKPPDQYRAGYWLSGDEILFVLQATNLHHEEVPAPRSWDMMIDRLVERLKDKEFDNWESAILNTDKKGRPGKHWIIGLWCVLSDYRTQVVLWEPWGTNRLSGHIRKFLELLPGVTVIAHLTGVQVDFWRCGYICAYWLLMINALIQNGEVPTEWKIPETHDFGGGWEDFVWQLCRIRDLQQQLPKETARTIGIAAILRDCWDNGRPAFSRLTRATSAHMVP
jgi:hypothetical protein